MTHWHSLMMMVSWNQIREEHNLSVNQGRAVILRCSSKILMRHIMFQYNMIIMCLCYAVYTTDLFSLFWFRILSSLRAGEDYDAEEEDSGVSKSDSELMPPPPLPRTSEVGSLSPSEDRRKPITPLAAMLPSKYANVDVREIFPDFRTDAVSTSTTRCSIVRTSIQYSSWLTLHVALQVRFFFVIRTFTKLEMIISMHHIVGLGWLLVKVFFFFLLLSGYVRSTVF